VSVVVFQPRLGSTPNRLRITLITLISLLAAVVIILVIVLLSGKNTALASSVRTEPVSSAGSDPFAPDAVGTDQSVPPVQTSGTVKVEGGHVGLFGGTRNSKACDKRQLVTFLQQNPDKATAWASVLGISRDQIPSYVDGLTPVLLRSDTLVTNHGYANGRITVVPALLEAGTAVLVDDRGFPVTKCYCGNPLTPPSYYSPGYHPKYFGPRWSGFSGSSVTIIQNNTTVINTFTLVDPFTRQPFDRPRGSDGSADVPTGSTLPTPTPGPLVTATKEPTAFPTQTGVPETSPPESQLPSTPSGPTPEQQAIAKVNRGAAACYPFPPPIEQGYGQNSVSTGLNDPNTFVLTVVTHKQNGSTLQVFTWSVSRSTLEFTPTNDLAQAASDHCPQLR
jgi:hypothetical protein